MAIPPSARIRCAGHGIADYPPGCSFGPRTLRDFEFVWIIDGEAERELDGRTWAAPAGTVILARPGQRERYRWDRRRPTRHGFIHFAVDRPVPAAGWPEQRAPRPDAGEGIVRPLLRHVLWLLDARPPGWEALAADAVRCAVAAWIADADRAIGDGGGALHPVVARTLDAVGAAWADGICRPLPLARLARAAGATPAWLSRCFQREVGCPPVEALRRLRLDRAAQLLARGDLPVAAVAARAGFADPFHFSRAFRACYGCSPRGFRGRIAAGGDMPAAPLVRVRQLAERIRSRAV